MKMFKRIISAALAVLMIVTILLTIGGCNPDDQNYPVTIGQTKFKEKPEKVAVLSDNLADIIYYMGYSTQICAISDECTQEEMTKYISSVGSEKKPDVDAIIASGAECVIVDTPLLASTKDKLEENGIEVINMMVPTTAEQLKLVYTSLGAMLGGNLEGKETATSAYERLMSTLEQAEKQTEGSTIVKMVCYLYINENGELCSYNNTTCEGMVLDYVSATNVAANFPDEKVDESILRMSNPEFIFYDSNEVMDYLHANSTLSNLNALKNKNVFLLPKSSLQRLGGSLIATQSFMLSKMFPESFSQPQGESLAERYGLTLKDDMSYKFGDDHADIKPIQQRLIDLGYLTLPEGDTTTSYFGSMTEEAVKSFQGANGIEENGVADYKTLELLFASTTLGTQGTAFIPDNNTEATEPDTTTTVTEPAPTQPATGSQSGSQTNGYSIDLSSEKSYQRGDENADIAVIQQRLVDLLYLSFPEGESVTNFYGGGTEHAITLFQESNGLSQTGVADYDTLKVLFSENAKLPN